MLYEGIDWIMNRKQEIFEKVLKNSYEHEEFVGFVKEFLTKTELVAPNRYEEEKSKQYSL